MGGAQAGEVASEIAVQQFEGGLPDGREPAEALVELIQAANARIHDAGPRSDAAARGHGHDADRRVRRTRTPSSSRTSATRAATCCATAT